MALLPAVLLVVGCGLLPSAPPDWVVNRLPLASCGQESQRLGDEPDRRARSCLLAAYEAGSGAELISTITTIEGDPVVRYVRVHENGTVEIFVDATRDAFGSGTWERLRCERLVPVAEANEPPDLVFPDELVFVEDGCESLPVP